MLYIARNEFLKYYFYKFMITFNPGPSQISKACEKEMLDLIQSGVLCLSHRSEKISELCLDSLDSLRSALNVPDNFCIFFQPSATAAMETVLRNCVQEKSFHFVHGAFSSRFYQTALDIKLDAKALTSPDSQAVPWKGAIFTDAELICVTLNETSSGLYWPKEEIQNLRKASDALIAIDATSILGGYQMDWQNFDLCFASVQKCLGLPSGLGLLFANERAMQAAKNKKGIAAWQSLEPLEKKMQKGQTFETPNLFLILLLGRQMKHFNVEKNAERISLRAKKIYEQFTPYVKDKSWRSPTVLNLVFEEPKLLHQKAQGLGYTLGKGYKNLKDSCIRLANFPSIEDEHFEAIAKILKM